MLVPFLLPPGCGEEEAAAILKYASGQHLGGCPRGLPQSSDCLGQLLHERKLSCKHIYTSVIGGFYNSKGRSIHD